MPRKSPPRTDPARPKHAPPRNPGHRPDPARPAHQPPPGTDQDSEAPLTARTPDDPRGIDDAVSSDRDQDAEAPRTAIPPAKR
jgi:hypothetical protein